MESLLPSVLWLCWLGSRKGIRSVKNWVVGCWHGYLSEARCSGAHLHMAKLMPLPLTESCFNKIQIGFAFLVPARPGSPGQRAVKWVWSMESLCDHFLPVIQSHAIWYDDSLATRTFRDRLDYATKHTLAMTTMFTLLMLQDECSILHKSVQLL